MSFKPVSHSLSLVLAACLAACGGSAGNDDPSAPDSGGSSSGGGEIDGPAVAIDARPAAVTKDAFATVGFSSSGAARFECSLDGAPASTCASPFVAMPLDVGAHQLKVTAFDASGRAGAPALVQWTNSSIFGDAADSVLHPDLIRTSVVPAPVAPNSWKGILRINCDFAHAAYDDPIVFPDQPGKAHLHRFYGNMLTDASSTTQSLFTQGASTCQGNELNRSAYWVPTLLAPAYEAGGGRARDSNGDPAFKAVPAVVGNDEVAHEIFYYSAGVSDLASIQPIPLGLKMIAGDHMGSPGMEQDSSIARWHCQSWESDEATNPRWSTRIPECAAPDRLRFDLFFPSCWNGTDLDSADHKSHLAYPVASGSRTVCPATHPVPIIRVSFHYAFGVLPDVADPATGTTRGWQLASDGYTVSTGAPGGMSLHGDWFNAWHPEALDAILEGCIQRGLDCHDGNLGNGYRLSGTQPGTQVEPAVINGGKGG
ncbi:DUF1996 domain-containing protein [Sphingomicrobium aestuariivivum]|uniref:DUF1996 domain-containing protein n=1 Tax=Sphingomicrobium aestuariivivum TaxID=1582356 RepID=UPI001FD6DE01|nr:DUF1996 domain-containing protein [Sphingomicrobium aestuariivivum]MCJ8191094.1 DUF1996 domain-containing protein [Sphingomicrobium aestuariivivum]